MIGRDSIDPSLVFDWKCSSAAHPWSITTLATSNSQLAGVLAGFMVVGMAVTAVAGVGAAVGAHIGDPITITTHLVTAAGCACGFCAIIIGWCGASGAAGNVQST